MITVSKQLSFIIPHMGREQMLTETLASIAQQDFDTSKVEIIVVTKNQQIDETVAAMASTIPLKVIYAEQALTISHQRNMGAAAAVGEYFAFLDADVFLAPNWISALLKILSEHADIKLVSAVQKNSHQAPPLEQLRTALSNAAIDCEVEFLPGRNLLLHRDTFILSQGFPEHLITCEDYVFTQRIAELGKLFYSSDSDYIHLGEDKAFWLMAEKEVWRGQSNIASLAGRKIPLSEWPSFIAPPVFTFGCIIALICTLLGANLLAIASICAALFILAIYSIRLRRITKGKPNTLTILKFYIMYFPARTWGTIKGILPSK
ncbi:glycosyltransferase family 2 protein [Glaciecola sp. SC05]|uniref:glycosyltransferase n=1 Tax=Glaciecola sp. SC05 TaxID=1987355 RepID=UPI0035291336